MKKYIILIIVFVLFLLLSIYSYVSAVSNDLSDSVFRLHVIANSDSEEDQNLKYKVRDSLINYMNDLTSNVSSKDEVIKIAQEHIEEFELIAKQTIEENGFDYTVEVEIGNFSFPTKAYGNVSFPSGFYDALKVKIGNADGQNWWCVMFPPLCFVDVTSGILPDESKETLQNNLNDEEYALISNEDDLGLSIKFKLVEWFEKIAQQ